MVQRRPGRGHDRLPRATVAPLPRALILLAVSSGPGGWIAAFGAGMLSFVSPCVLPLVPGYLSLMSGVSTSELVAGRTMTTTDTRRLLRSTLLFVAGFTVVFVALGATASVIGDTLVDHQRGLEKISGVLVMAMGLLIAGAVSPTLLQRERRFHVSPAGLGPFAAPVMGMAFAFGWTPCIGPVLASVLAFAASEGTLTEGVILLLAYSLGLGVPFVVAGLAFGRLTAAFAFMKRHARVISLVSGVLLVVFGWALYTGRVSRWSGDLIDFMDRVGLDFLTKI